MPYPFIRSPNPLTALLTPVPERRGELANFMGQSTYRLTEAIADHIVESSQTRLGEMVASYKTLKRANEELEYITGITRFFESKNEFQEFQRILALPVESNSTAEQRSGKNKAYRTMFASCLVF